MKPAVIIPFRPDVDERISSLRAVVRCYKAMGLTNIFAIDATPLEEFHLAAPRNRGVLYSQHLGFDIAIVADVDILPDRAPLTVAIESCHDGRLHIPYTRCRMLTQRGSKEFLAGVILSECECHLDWQHSVGGIFVMLTQSWCAIGGNDERFVGWGCEDIAFSIAAEARVGLLRHPGVVHHLWHRENHRSRTATSLEHNEALLSRYNNDPRLQTLPAASFSDAPIEQAHILRL